jgi:hypothetical protein
MLPVRSCSPAVMPGLAVLLQCFDGAVRQQREVAPGQVGGVDHFVERHAQGVRQALTAQLWRGGQAGPATIDELVVGLLEAGRGGHFTGGLVEHAADLVADAVERGEQGFDLEHVVQGETEVGKRGGVAAHRYVSI